MTHPSSSGPPPTEAAAPAAHVVSATLRRRLQQCYEFGTKLAAQETYDFDYAHTLFAECVSQDPGNLVYVEALLANLDRKFHHNKRGSRLAMFSSKGAIKKAFGRKDWGEVLKSGPEALKQNPWDVPTLRALADASAAYGYGEVELRYLRQALDANPHDPEVNRHCALTLTRIGQFDQAMACWHRVEEARPNDPEPPERISQLQTEKTRPRVGFGGPEVPSRPRASASSEEPPKTADDGPPDQPGAHRRREIPRTPRQRLEQDIQENPTVLETYFELADLHVREGRLVDAHRILEKALAASGNSPQIQEKLDDVGILRLKDHLTIAERRGQSEKDPAAEQLVQQLRADLNRLELDVYTRRCQRYPHDPQLRLELGIRLKRSENYQAALQEFQALREHPELKVAATFEIAECHQRLRVFAKALQVYQHVVDLATQPPDLDYRRKSLLRGASLAVGLKDYDTAEKNLRLALELDPGSQDIQDRLDKLRQIRDKG